MNLAITLSGASGRMGQALVRLIAEDENMSLVGALDQSSNPFIGKDVGDIAGAGTLGVTLTDNFDKALDRADVVIDFTLPGATPAILSAVQRHKVALVMGTTGHDEPGKQIIRAAGDKVPLVWSANYSVGVTVLRHLAFQAARTLGKGWDIEVLEMHHRKKVDAPSGTALALGQAAAEGREWQLNNVKKYERSGYTGARPDNEIGFATLRGGNVAGDHSLIFATDNERIELNHRATNRDIFARGALRAARWVSDKPIGLYDMTDVLGLG